MSKFLTKHKLTSEFDEKKRYLARPHVALTEDTWYVYYLNYIPVEGVSLDKTEISIHKLVSEQLTAYIQPSIATRKQVTWSSSDESVATVDAQGLVTSVDYGNAVITVTTVDGGFTAQCAVSVVKYHGEVTIEPTAKTSLVYNGKSQEVINSGSGSGTMLYKFSDGEWGTNIPSASDARTYTIYYKAAESADYYESVTGSVTASIAKVTPSIVSPTIVKDLIYNGTPQALINGGLTDWGIMKYSLDGTNYSANIPSGTNATSYTIYYKVEGNSNVNDTEAMTLSNSIAKVTPTVVAPTAKILTYNGSEQELANEGSTDFGTMQYKVDEIWSTEMPTKINGGLYGLSYRVVGDSNINDVESQNIVCSINEKEVTASVEVNPTAYTYNGSAFEPTVTVKDGSTIIDPSEYTVSYSNNVNAGSGAVTTISDKLGGNYNVIGSSTFVINKVTPTVVAPTPITGITYNSTPHQLVNAATTDWGVLKYSLDNENWSTSIPSGTNAGNYTVYYKVDGDSNINDVLPQSVNVSILKAKGLVTTIPTQINGLIYNTEPQTLLNSGSGTGTMVYKLEGETWGTFIPSGTNVGNYTVYYKATESANYTESESGSVLCSIGKASPTYTAPSAKNLTYNGEAQELINSGSTNHGTITYSTDNISWSSTIPTSTNASSSIIVYWKLDGDANHSNINSTVINCSIAKANGTLNIDGVSLTYDGTPRNLITVSDNTGTMHYKVDDGEWTENIPIQTNANSWTIYWYMDESANYNGIESASSRYVSSTIAKANGSVSNIPTPRTLTYNGEPQELITAGSGTGTMLYKPQIGDWGTSIPTATNAGTYTVYYKASASTNYNESVSGSVDVTIAKVTISPTVSMNGWVYGQTSANPTVNGNIGSGYVTYMYKVSTAGDNTYTTTKPSDVGTYTVRAQVAETPNYNSGECTTNFSISKADPSFISPSAKSLTYNGEAQELLNSGSTSDGTMQYSSDNSSWSTTIPSNTNADTYTSYWRIIGDSNHNDKASASINTTISKASGSVTTEPTAKSLTYNGGEQYLVNEGSGTGTMLYYGGSNSSWSYSIPTATNATTYTIFYKAAESANYNESSRGYVNVTIAKVTPTVIAPTPKTLTYNTSAQVLANAGSTNYGTIKYSLDNSTYSTSVPSATNANVTYTLYYKVDGDSNVNDVAASSIYCSIAEKRVTTPTITLSPSSYTYNGSYCQPTATVKDGSTVIPSSEYTTTYSNNLNAGTATVTISDNTAGNYYISGSTTFSIAKASGSVTTAPTAKSLTYNGGAQYLINGGSGTGTMLYYGGSNSSWSTSIPTATNAGTYTIYYKASASTNYNESTSGSVSVTISKASGSVSINGVSLSYNGASRNLVTVSSNTGTMHYKVGNGSWTTTIPTSTNCGSWTIYWYMDESTNYSGIGSSSSRYVSSSISKINPTISAAPTNRNVTYNGSAQYLLTGGTANVSGSWSYSTGTNAGSYTATWTFTPSDTTNYNTMNGSVAATIAKASGSVSINGVSLSYNGASRNLVTVSSNTGTMHYKVGNGSWTTTIPTSTNCGSWTIYWYMDESTNYTAIASASSRYVSSSISKINPTISAAPTNRNVTYNGSAQYLLTGGTANVSGSWSYSTGTNAGSYTATWTFTPSDTTNYNTMNGSVAATIAKASGSAYATANSWTYNGNAYGVVYNAGGYGSIQYQLSGSSWTTTVPTATNAGTYYCRVYSSGDANHNEAYSGWYTCTVSKAVGYVSTAPTNRGTTYNGTIQTLAKGGTGTGTMYYSTNNSSFDPSLPISNTAGSWTLYYYAAESANYTQSPTGSISISMNKANWTISVSRQGWTYGENPKSISVGNSGVSDGSPFFTFYYKVSTASDSTYTTTDPSNAGTYTVKAVAAGTKNMNETSVTANYTIAKATPSISWSIRPANYYIEKGETAQCRATTTSDGSIVYSSSNSNYVSVNSSSGLLTGVNQGDVTITASVAATTNYNATAITDSCRCVNTYNGHGHVDLGLSSGTIWATTNVGASNEGDYGNYYRYGDGATNTFNNRDIYRGTEDPLDYSVDTAVQVWGAEWHTPEAEQWLELYNSTSQSVTTRNGHQGMLFTANNGNSIFIPYAGYYTYSIFSGVKSYNVGQACCVMSSTPNDETECTAFDTSDYSYAYLSTIQRSRWISVRPVVGIIY